MYVGLFSGCATINLVQCNKLKREVSKYNFVITVVQHSDAMMMIKMNSNDLEFLIFTVLEYYSSNIEL